MKTMLLVCSVIVVAVAVAVVVVVSVSFGIIQNQNCTYVRNETRFTKFPFITFVLYGSPGIKPSIGKIVSINACPDKTN